MGGVPFHHSVSSDIQDLCGTIHLSSFPVVEFSFLILNKISIILIIDGIFFCPQILIFYVYSFDVLSPKITEIS